MSKVLGSREAMSTDTTSLRLTFSPPSDAAIPAAGPTLRPATVDAVSQGSPITLRVEELERSFGEHRAVRGLSFQAVQGEVLGLLGPNGAGKSTTLRLLAGLLAPDAGRIRLGSQGVDPRKPAARHQLGFVPQEIALYGELTAEENLRFFGTLYGLGGAALRERCAFALELSGLVERGSHRVRTFSGGMQRRLNLACAILHSPELLLLDEPTVGVDPQSRNHLFASLAALKAQGLTLIYSTHHMDDAQRLCDRVAIMDGGKILALSSPDELIRAHGAVDLEGVFLDLTGRRLRD